MRSYAAACPALTRCLFVNRFGPAAARLRTRRVAGSRANGGARIACRVPQHQNRRDITVASSSSGRRLAYDTRGRSRSWYKGTAKLLRLVGGLVDGLRLLAAPVIGHQIAIVMTEPPLLFMSFQMFRKFIAPELWYYTMDLYPDAFAAAGAARSEKRAVLPLSWRRLRHTSGSSHRARRRPARALRMPFERRYPSHVLACGVVSDVEARKPTSDGW